MDTKLVSSNISTCGYVTMDMITPCMSKGSDHIPICVTKPYNDGTDRIERSHYYLKVKEGTELKKDLDQISFPGGVYISTHQMKDGTWLLSFKSELILMYRYAKMEDKEMQRLLSRLRFLSSSQKYK